tara:strand:- start:221 stop:436 length:216 start_codon:yes stop_codon:yes gene_type:complete
MIACHICGVKKGRNKFSDKDRDQRLSWCKECAAMYEEMKREKAAAEWEEANRKAIGFLKLTHPSSFSVSFK